MGDTWFTSDMHFGHVRIIEFCNRPYDSLDEMNEHLITLWNDTVKPEDEVYILGDAVMGKRMETLEHVKKLHGTKYLIPGNHDYCHPMHKKATEWVEHYQNAGLTVLSNILAYGKFEDNVLMCHFPTALGEYDDRDFERWAPKPPYRALIHGHVHQAWKVNGNQINVGMDVWDLKPVHRDVIDTLIGEVS